MGSHRPLLVLAQDGERGALGAHEPRRPAQAPDDRGVDLVRRDGQELSCDLGDQGLGADALSERPLGGDLGGDVSRGRLHLEDFVGLGVPYRIDATLEPDVVAVGVAIA